jgi:type IV secretory pathway TraG/TraD family ATPase VirD4
LESLPPKIRDRIFEFGPYVLSIVSPFALFYAIGFAVASRAVTTYPIRREGQIDANALTHNNWNQIVHELKRSPTTVNSLFLGFNAADNSPIIVPREVFQEHAHLLGDTGSGKTSLGLGPLITQLIRMKDLSVVVVDMKGDDLALLHGTKLEAEKAGLRFRWFSNELDRPTYTFNPLAQQAFQKLSIYQRTDILLNALGLQYGTDYGKAYFSDANAQMLFHAMKAKPTARSFQELVSVLRNPSNFVHVSKAIVRDGSHLMAIIERLASFAPLNTLSAGNNTPDQVFADSIDFKSVFEEPEVLYFHLSSPLGTASSAEMARLALYGILSAAKAAHGTRRQVILVIDEFQRIIAKNLELFLQTARSFNIGVVLANQSLRDLKSNDFDLASTVKTNCRFKQYFSVSDPMEIAELSKSSGDTLIHNRSTSLGGQALSFLVGRYLYDTMTFTEQQVPRLSTNQILLAGDNPKQSIVQLRRGAGYAQFGGFPFVLSGTHHISAEEYERRKLLPWPDATEGTITPSSTEEISQPNEITGPLFFDSPLLTDAKPKTPEPTLSPETRDDAKTWRKSIRNKKKPKSPD